MQSLHRATTARPYHHQDRTEIVKGISPRACGWKSGRCIYTYIYTRCTEERKNRCSLHGAATHLTVIATLRASRHTTLSPRLHLIAAFLAATSYRTRTLVPICRGGEEEVEKKENGSRGAYRINANGMHNLPVAVVIQ